MAARKEYRKNFVTLYTDATCNEDGHLAWAFWARHDNGRLKLTGVCPDDLTDITQGEMYAICQGMHKVLKYVEKVEGFYVNTDSMGALNTLKNKYSEKTKKGKDRHPVVLRLKKAYDKMVQEFNLEMDLRHVKAHTGKTHIARFWLNNWCDKMAKEALKKHTAKKSGSVTT